MRHLTHAVAFGVSAALAVAFGVTAASPAAATPAPHHAATTANPCTAGAAPSGRTVSGALSRTEVQHRLGSLTRQHREATGYRAPATAGRRSGPAAEGPLLMKPAKRPFAQIHPAMGTSFKTDAGDGSCATQSVSTAVNVTDGSTTIYTPTMYPPGGSCIELVTVYTQGQRSVSAWDWCRAVTFEASVPIDGTFLATYTDGSSSAYTGRVMRTDAATNAWTASLYNYQTGTWDQLYSQSGQNQSGRNDGWDINELYSTTDRSGVAYSCRIMSGITFESRNISLRVNGTWTAADPDNADTHYDSGNASYDCPDRTYQMISKYDHWKAVG